MRWPAGLPGRIATGLSVGLSAYALYWVLFIVQPQVYRVSFLLVALVLTFLLFPIRRGAPSGVGVLDWCLIAAAVTALGWPLVDFSRFVYRAAEPTTLDIALGATAVVLVLEATRRAVGWILPATAAAFLAYAWVGPAFDRIGLPLLAHRGYQPDRLIGTLYMTLEGIFGVPLDVTATYIVLFTIFGAVLEQTGAGRFFIEWAFAATGGSRSAAATGRSVTVAGFLLGSVSGSGVATTVMLGSVAWPLMRRAGYAAETAGAILSAAGIGALLSPPTLGAAAFLIAEFLQISYLQVLIMATVPTLLYYLSIFLMIQSERDAGAPAARGAGVRVPAASAFADASLDPRPPDDPAPVDDLLGLTTRYWFHFTSLVAIAALMAFGMSAFRAVFWATLLAAALSYLRRETALTPGRAWTALRGGAVGVLGVAATTATAGIIVGVVTLTGLGLKAAGIIVSLAGGTLVLTVVYSAVAVWLLGLAVPVTASYIIAAVMVAPALVSAGVPDTAAHMFIFYYAVLSEVSPPTALSPFAAAAITGGNPFRTMMLTWKYTLPAFLVPFVFTLSPEGLGVLLRGSGYDAAAAGATAAGGVWALSGGIGGRVFLPARRSGGLRTRPRAPLTPGERAGLIVAGLLLFYANRGADFAGIVISAVVLFLHQFRRSHGAAANPQP